MIIFDRERLEALLDRFSTGFGATRLDIILFAAAIIAIIAFLIASYVFIRRREQRRLSRAIESKNDRLFARYRPDQRERALLDDLSVYLKDPRKQYLLLSNSSTFAACLQKLRADGEVDSEAVRSLQNKLGFDLRRQIHRLSTTADLPVGIPVILEPEGGHRINARLTEQGTDTFAVKTTDAVRLPSSGVRANVYTHDPRGVFAFSTTVVRTEDGTVNLKHSRSLRHAQRRKYYRRRMRAPIVVRREDSSEKPKPTVLLDLGGGGASLRNPDSLLEKGDDVRIYLSRGPRDWLPINGEVVRLSRNGAVAHVRFGHLEDRQRDQIVRIVNRGSV